MRSFSGAHRATNIGPRRPPVPFPPFYPVDAGGLVIPSRHSAPQSGITLPKRAVRAKIKLFELVAFRRVCVLMVGGMSAQKASRRARLPIFRDRNGKEVSVFMVDERVRSFAGSGEVCLFGAARCEPMRVRLGKGVVERELNRAATVRERPPANRATFFIGDKL